MPDSAVLRVKLMSTPSVSMPPMFCSWPEMLVMVPDGMRWTLVAELRVQRRDAGVQQVLSVRRLYGIVDRDVVVVRLEQDPLDAA